MIVNATPTGWEVIYHRSHALLAAQIAGQWQRKNAPARIYETLAAISHHDDLEKEWEENNLTQAGAPMDFMMNKEASVEKLASLIKNARYRGRWVTLLISMHISRLTEPKRGQSAELDAFLDEQIENQRRWREELGIEKDEVDAAYAFMQWCDRLSLILCQKELPADERFLEISKGPDGQRYDIMQRSDNLVTVKPWPFEDDKFTVNVEACDLQQAKFASNSKLTQALQTAPIKVLEWTFVKK
ncbi:DUF3891 family protein [Anabaena sp. FACHB-709]|uniref:DUF3891 domain-containing protein n=2 Tax=Nostocaceae TaxID=1162 RepID=A0A1Z4KIA9_ANAVA|nr:MULTISPECIES: DUF3891 family protein [Nostocaceae]BAY68716.1 hypothetical protein NIES23_15040 [Trichormus variabilis NIES-23]HBW33638.1 DUF3891 domain-containing protein [Nostoc sp. UBA8866]MBD2170296.1 DUF3891 family protein [Anabaena cylindrica FACHB-318]MBD2262224.1 DUF3891 family protein [Anabaena sp. FACHB-709]MBD2271629.1 DUF3891 family protein [Nostoc sp. PCC 7120 = FACHB-418]